MATALTRVRTYYGANPLHLLALLGCFALAGCAALRTLSEPTWPVILLWFLGAVIGHDLVLFRSTHWPTGLSPLGCALWRRAGAQARRG